MAATTPTAQPTTPPALASAEIQDTRQSPFSQLWRDTPYEGQLMLLAALAVALIIVARQAGAIAKARWHRDDGKAGPAPPSAPPGAVDLGAVLDELRGFGQQLAELKTQQTVVPAFVTAAIERSERNTTDAIARLEHRFEASLVRLHERVDGLTVSKANAADLHRLEQRVDRLSGVP